MKMAKIYFSHGQTIKIFNGIEGYIGEKGNVTVLVPQIWQVRIFFGSFHFPPSSPYAAQWGIKFDIENAVVFPEVLFFWYHQYLRAQVYVQDVCRPQEPHDIYQIENGYAQYRFLPLDNPQNWGA